MSKSPWSLTFRHWLVLAIASIGFLFDTYELLMTPLVGVPAIAELTNLPPNHPDVTNWMGTLLWLTALCGGIFGLAGGWLIDRFGRKRIMAVSIFVYAFSPFAAAFSTTLPMFIFFRCTTFIGVCVEFVAAITWLAELFPEKRQREIFLGSTQAFASLGGVLITWVSAAILTSAPHMPAVGAEMTLIGLVLITILFLLVGHILIVVQAFRTSVGWGLAALLIPFAALVFVFRHWQRAKNPFVIYLIGLVVFFIGVALSILSKDGGLQLPVMFDAHATWRYTLMTGLLPAIPIALMLPFVPESQVWRERREAGTLKRPSFGELFSPQLRRVTLVTAGLSACAYGAAFGALQLTPLRIAPGTPELREQQETLRPLRADAKALNDQLTAVEPDFQQALKDVPALKELAAKRAQNRKAFRVAKPDGAKPNPSKAAELGAEFKELTAQLGPLTASHPEAKTTLAKREDILKKLGDNRALQTPADTAVKERGNTSQFYQENGGLVGRILLALLIVAAIPRRSLLRIFLIPGLAVLPLTYFSLYHAGGAAFDWGIFACGLLIVSQFSYFGEYLPKVFPLHLRGTGGSFATNVGGRMIGTSAALLTTKLIAPHISASNTFDQVAMAAGIVGLTVFVIGFILSFLLPDPKHEDLPEGGEAAKAAVQNLGVTPAA